MDQESRQPITGALPEPAPVGEPALRGLTTADIESFKALGAEVCIASELFGQIWLVPVYRDSSRAELVPEHALTIIRVLEAFPGSRVAAFEKLPTAEEVGGDPR